MRTLSDIYREVETVADFTGIQVNDPNALGRFQSRPLHVAAVWGDCEAIELLVQAGARGGIDTNFLIAEQNDLARRGSMWGVQLPA